MKAFNNQINKDSNIKRYSSVDDEKSPLTAPPKSYYHSIK